MHDITLTTHKITGVDRDGGDLFEIDQSDGDKVLLRVCATVGPGDWPDLAQAITDALQRMGVPNVPSAAL